MPQAYEEYVKAWFACKILAKVYGLGDPDGFVFNMSVGYDLAGIKGEKIDIISWSENPEELIASVLSPAKVENVFANEEEKTATVIVPDYQLSLAIGKEGQNVRLAAKLSGWKIDIKSHTQYFGNDPEIVEYADDEEFEEIDG